MCDGSKLGMEEVEEGRCSQNPKSHLLEDGFGRLVYQRGIGGGQGRGIQVVAAPIPLLLFIGQAPPLLLH